MRCANSERFSIICILNLGRGKTPFHFLRVIYSVKSRVLMRRIIGRRKAMFPDDAIIMCTRDPQAFICLSPLSGGRKIGRSQEFTRDGYRRYISRILGKVVYSDIYLAPRLALLFPAPAFKKTQPAVTEGALRIIPLGFTSLAMYPGCSALNRVKTSHYK